MDHRGDVDTSLNPQSLTAATHSQTRPDLEEQCRRTRDVRIQDSNLALVLAVMHFELE